MFKHRIHSWGADKKLKEDDVLQILRILAPVCQVKSQTSYPFEFVVRGMRVKDLRLRRYIARTPRVLDRFYAGAVPSADSIRAVKYQRAKALEPAGSPIPEDPSAATEQLLCSIRLYVTGCLNSDEWLFNDAHCWSTRPSSMNEPDLHDAWHLPLAAVMSRWEQNQTSEDLVGDLGRFFDILSEVVKTHPPFFLSCLFGILLVLQRRQQYYLSRMLINQVVGLCSIFLGEDHGLCCVMQRLQPLLAEDRDISQLVQQCLLVLLHTFEDQIGLNNALTLLTSISYLVAKVQSEGITSGYLQLLAKYIGSLARKSPYVMHEVEAGPWKVEHLKRSWLSEGLRKFSYDAMAEEEWSSTMAAADPARHAAVLSINTTRRHLKFHSSTCDLSETDWKLLMDYTDAITGISSNSPEEMSFMCQPSPDNAFIKQEVRST
jgi:hypothetical protein